MIAIDPNEVDMAFVEARDKITPDVMAIARRAYKTEAGTAPNNHGMKRALIEVLQHLEKSP